MIALTGGRVMDPSQGLDAVVDILIERGVITSLGAGAAGPHAGADPQRVQVIALHGKWVMPGFIDLHVHLREPGSEGKEDIASGLRAAAAGGFTTVCAMPNTRPVNDSKVVTRYMQDRARDAASTRLLTFGAMTKGSQGVETSNAAELKEAGVMGLSDDGRCVVNAGVMRRVMENAFDLDLLVSQHAEDHTLTEGAQMHEGAVSYQLGLKGWPAAAEDIIVARDLILAELTGARYHVAHLSTLGSVRLLREAKSRGLKVTAEVTPHHLLLTDESVLGYNTSCKVNPPLRSAEHVETVLGALADGTIDCIATDHAPHAKLDKSTEFDKAAHGMTGLECMLPLMLQLVRENKLTLNRLVDALTTKPGAIGKINAGTLKEGARADITVIDPELIWKWTADTVLSKSTNSPFLGQSMRGAVTHTFVDGRMVYRRA